MASKERYLWLLHSHLDGVSRVWWAYFEDWAAVQACIAEITKAFPGFELQKLETCHEILQTPVHSVPSNQKLLSNQRFYTVDLSVHAAAREHHLMELCTYDGKNDLHLIIRQFREDIEGSSNVLLAHNEVEELLAMLLQQRFQEVEEKYKRKMAYKDED